MHKDRLEAECGRFMEMLKKLRITIPFLEAMVHMLRYAKYLKGLLAKKPKYKDLANVTLREECSAFIFNKLPKKQPDPGSFTIPLCIRNHHIENSLADLGASINVMSYKIFKKFHLGELKPIRLNVTLADRSVINPRGIMEDVLVRVGNFYYPTDFVILDIDEDADMPLILGRPFLATAKALIDVNEVTLVLRDGEEQLTLSINAKVKNDVVKEMESSGMNGSGGEPLKASPTSVCIPFDDEVQETKEGTKPRVKKKRAWRDTLHQAYSQPKDKAKVSGQEGHPMELKVGGDKPGLRPWRSHSRWLHALKHDRSVMPI
ncbi:unnamed protein product [Linum trigynum]|uniref:Uncharacterized protein n=1 Tax=Linum trigynum TaxID=586398 RepID=A0AAV2E154_9ROSI